MRPARALVVALAAVPVLLAGAPPVRSAAAPAAPPAPAALAVHGAPTRLAAFTPAGPSLIGPSLAVGLDAVLADPRLAGASVAVVVRDAVSGATLYARNPDLRLLPASNLKLLTAAAALEVLGPEHRFHTRVRHSGTRTGPVVDGDLHLHGEGDPTMTAERYDALAAAVAGAGVTRVTGRLVADDSWFDRVPYGLDWSWQDDNPRISALTFAVNGRSPTGLFPTGVVEIRYRPGPPGEPPLLTTTPRTTTVRVVNKAVTGLTGTGLTGTVTAARAPGSHTIRVTGSARTAGSVLVSVPSPVAVSAGLFRAALRRHGVTVSGPTVLGPASPGPAAAGRTVPAAGPGTAVTLTDQVSVPLAALLGPLLKFSTNSHAELLVKAMGRATAPDVPGSWTTGLTAASAALAGLGVDTATLTLGDGSGLSRRNWVTARHLTTLLAAARTRPWFPAFRAALPVAGDPDPQVGGTLRNRMIGTVAAGAVRAKTGSLAGVNTLSGYATAQDGRELIFAALSNGAAATVSDVLDGVAVTIAGGRTT